MIPGIVAGAAAVGGVGPTDPYFANVSALLHLDGADGSTTITDQKGNTWMAVGGAELDTAISKFGPSSGKWAGASPQIYCSTAVLLDMSNDFTVEYWVNQAAVGSPISVHAHFYNGGAGSAEGLNIYRHSTTGMLHVDNGIAAAPAGASTITLNTWVFVAVVRDGGTIRAYVDGVQCLANAMQSYPSTVDFASLGFYRIAGYPLDGHMDDFRVTNGVCRYPGGTTFTPPTAPFPNS